MNGRGGQVLIGDRPDDCVAGPIPSRGLNDGCHCALFAASRTETIPRLGQMLVLKARIEKGKMMFSCRYLTLFDIQEIILVGPEGFEPPTKGL